MMRRLLWFAMLFTSLGVLFGQQSDNVGLTLTISAPAETVKVGTDVYIKVRMKNTSDHDVDCSSYYMGQTDRRFRVEVHDESGKLMNKADLHPELMPGSFEPCTLVPGESTVNKDDRISWLNDFSRPGKYMIQLSRVVARDEKNGMAKSNKITISIVP